MSILVRALVATICNHVINNTSPKTYSARTAGASWETHAKTTLYTKSTGRPEVAGSRFGGTSA